MSHDCIDTFVLLLGRSNDSRVIAEEGPCVIDDQIIGIIQQVGQAFDDGKFYCLKFFIHCVRVRTVFSCAAW